MGLVDLNGMSPEKRPSNVVGNKGGTISIISHPNHSWIVYVDNETKVTTSIGTWGNREHVGVNYNIELSVIAQGGYEGRVSSTVNIDSNQAKALWKFIDENDEWGIWNNCSNFAVKAWESAGQKPFNQNSWVFGIPTPGALAHSVSRSDGYEIDKNFDGGCDAEENKAR